MCRRMVPGWCILPYTQNTVMNHVHARKKFCNRNQKKILSVLSYKRICVRSAQAFICPVQRQRNNNSSSSSTDTRTKHAYACIVAFLTEISSVAHHLLHCTQRNEGKREFSTLRAKIHISYIECHITCLIACTKKTSFRAHVLDFARQST
jgi:hypothetical protein